MTTFRPPLYFYFENLSEAPEGRVIITRRKRSYNISNASEDAEPGSKEHQLAKRRKLMEDSMEELRAGLTFKNLLFYHQY